MSDKHTVVGCWLSLFVKLLKSAHSLYRQTACTSGLTRACSFTSQSIDSTQSPPEKNHLPTVTVRSQKFRTHHGRCRLQFRVILSTSIDAKETFPYTISLAYSSPRAVTFCFSFRLYFLVFAWPWPSNLTSSLNDSVKLKYLG